MRQLLQPKNTTELLKLLTLWHWTACALNSYSQFTQELCNVKKNNKKKQHTTKTGTGQHCQLASGTDRCSPGRPSRGTAASRWGPERTTTPPGSCWPSDCPGWGGAGAPEHGGVCWRSWTHSWDGGCGLSPAGVRFEMRAVYIFCSKFLKVCTLFFFDWVNWPSCLHPLVRHSGTECASSSGQRRVPDRWPRPERSWQRQNSRGK